MGGDQAGAGPLRQPFLRAFCFHHGADSTAPAEQAGPAGVRWGGVEAGGWGWEGGVGRTI